MTTLDKYKLNAAYSCMGDYPKTCGGLLEGASGTLVNSADTDCKWDIVAPQGSIIIVEFHIVDVCYTRSKV